ncbi:MAG TPA: NAD(+) diphosphatase [Steroidobacteraceae bacterium]|nr:NAD(+) diphosphatase [Steroidobacteraceae bacterium]
MTADLSQNPFTGAWLDRRSETRAEADWAARALSEPDARFLLCSGTQHLVTRGPHTAIAYLEGSDPLVRAADPEQLVQLGWYQGRRCVMVSVLPGASELPAGTQLEELRPLLTELPAGEAAVLACARALLIWRARHLHCGVCGAPTKPRLAGHCLRCTSSECGTEFFPRLDPAVIVLVSDGDHALLGRQPSWPPGRYSALAGFVEAGESLEDAVVREVREEAGVRARAVSYFASQPWPFPSSLMLGFHATADRNEALQLDGELEEARWFSAAELAAAAARLLPPPYSIARRLIETWFVRATGVALSASL